jgi:hypothetical protein
MADLVTSAMTPGTHYTVTVSKLKDQAATPNTIVPAATSFRAPLYAQGSVEWDYYYLGSPSGTVGDLTGNPNYPDAPQANANLTSFDTDQITGGDLNNNPAFGGTLGDNYGDSVSGWITPTVTTNYVFFLASDDASELQLSSDSNPQNATVIAQETGCFHGFVETNSASPPPQTSASIPLAAGTSYFIQALHSEGGGGDYVKVAWRMDGDPTPSSSLSPIPGQYLSSYGRPGFGAPTYSGGQFTVSWTGQAILQQSTDLVNWSKVPGNPNPLVVTVQPGTPKLFYRLIQIQ